MNCRTRHVKGHCRDNVSEGIDKWCRKLGEWIRKKNINYLKYMEIYVKYV